MNCIFCDLKDKIILKETKNFVIMVGKGIISVGHVMIIPKKHYKAIGDISDDMLEEFIFLKNELNEKIANNISKPFFVEYGVFMQSVGHAHMHVVPSSNTEYKNVNIINDLFVPIIKNKNLNCNKLENYKDLLEFYKEKQQYVYFEFNNEKYVIETNNLIKQDIARFLSIRKFFANNIGIKGIGSWQEMTEEDKQNDKIKIKKTVDVLKF
ncbi:MAG TPA: HIT family protein [Rickettsiales bacterium]|nr:HIT family protein [Rickettsiales bacterium]